MTFGWLLAHPAFYLLSKKRTTVVLEPCKILHVVPKLEPASRFATLISISDKFQTGRGLETEDEGGNPHPPPLSHDSAPFPHREPGFAPDVHKGNVRGTPLAYNRWRRANSRLGAHQFLSVCKPYPPPLITNLECPLPPIRVPKHSLSAIAVQGGDPRPDTEAANQAGGLRNGGGASG